MPTSKGKIKKTGDTHLPDIEFELPPKSGAKASNGEQGIKSGRLDRGLQKADFLKPEDTMGNDSSKTGNSGSTGPGSKKSSRPNQG